MLMVLAPPVRGAEQTANGSGALSADTSGYYNVAVGAQALLTNTSGYCNVAVGGGALAYNLTGNNNTAVGLQALFNSTGNNNLAFGQLAGYFLTAGDANIYIGHPGMLRESGTIRIGNPYVQSKTYLAGIAGTSVSNATVVVVGADGQLGTINLPSSRASLRSAQSDAPSGLAAGMWVMVPTNAAAPAGCTLLGTTAMAYNCQVLVGNSLVTRTLTNILNLYQKD